MPDEQAATSQADETAESQADTTTSSPADEREDEKDDKADVTISLAEAKKLRQEASNLRRRIKEAETRATDAESKVQAAADKDKGDVERLTQDRDRLTKDLEARESRLRELAITTALTTTATKAGARYPDLIVERIAKNAELDDDLTVTNADDLVQAAKADYPDLFKPVAVTADAGKKDQTKPSDNVKPGLNRLQFGYETESKTAQRKR